jgi:class 3 adenylate cyclase
MPCRNITSDMADKTFHSLEDFLISQPLTVNGVGEDGWGVPFAVKGREINGAVLFADISNFSGRTEALSSTETLIFVNHFFSWISAEALTDSHGIVDKYIGDEIMIVFSSEFGANDAFAEALTAAKHIGDQDPFAFSPHIGIASGTLTVGYVGTPLKYDCSVFGGAVVTAARCAGVKCDGGAPVSIVFPAAEWKHRSFDEFFPGTESHLEDGSKITIPSKWELCPSRTVNPKNMAPLEIIGIDRTTRWVPSISPAEWAREIAEDLKASGAYKAVI